MVSWIISVTPEMSLSPYQIRDRLLKEIKDDGTVRNRDTALDIIAMLENISITKQELEDTRLGKYINLVRKAAEDTELQKRAKKLIKTWQQIFTVSMQPKKRTPEKPPRQPPASTSHVTAQHRTASPSGKHAERTYNSTVNGEVRDRRAAKRKAESKSAVVKDNVKLQTDAKFSKNVFHHSLHSNNSKRLTNNASSPKNSKTRSPAQTPSRVESPATPNLTCKTNGLKIKISTLPPASPVKEEYTTHWHDTESRVRSKRKREDDVSPPDSLDSTRTNDEIASSSMTSSSLSPISNAHSVPFLSEPLNVNHVSPETTASPAPPSVKSVTETTPQNDAAANVTTVDAVQLTKCKASSLDDPCNPNEKSGVDGCRGSQGAWYSWSDSIFLRRPTELISQLGDSALVEPLAILPYVELE